MLKWFYIAEILNAMHAWSFERDKAVHSTSAHPPLHANLLWYCSPSEKIPLGTPRGDLQWFLMCRKSHFGGSERAHKDRIGVNAVKRTTD